MYFYIFITNGSCTPNPGCRKALSLREGTPLGLILNTARNSFCPPACRARYSTWSRNFIPIPEFCAHGPSIMKPRYGSPIFGNPKDNSASPDRRSSKKSPRRNDRFGSQFGWLLHIACSKGHSCKAAGFHAASCVLRVFPATHGFDFHEFVKTEQSTFPAITRLLVATKRCTCRSLRCWFRPCLNAIGAQLVGAAPGHYIGGSWSVHTGCHWQSLWPLLPYQKA